MGLREPSAAADKKQRAFEKKAPLKVTIPAKPTYLHVELDPTLHANLKSWVAKNRTNITSTVSTMIEEFLKKHG